MLGYNLVPFDAPQQVALQDSLDSVMPSINSPVRLHPSKTLQSARMRCVAAARAAG